MLFWDVISAIGKINRDVRNRVLDGGKLGHHVQLGFRTIQAEKPADNPQGMPSVFVMFRRVVSPQCLRGKEQGAGRGGGIHMETDFIKDNQMQILL